MNGSGAPGLTSMDFVYSAIARSWSLTTGFFWRTLGIMLLVAVIISFATSIVTTPLQLVISYGSLLINPNGDESATIIGVLVAYLRMRKEGLDLELAQFVEARQAGDTSIADPYLPREAPTAP